MTAPLLIGCLALLAGASPWILRGLLRGWDLHATFFALLLLAPITAILIAAVTRAKLQLVDSQGLPELIGNENQAQSDALSLVVIILAIMILLRGVLTGGRLALAGPLLCVSAILVTTLSNALTFPLSFDRPVIGMALVFLGCCVGAPAASVGRGVTMGLLVVIWASTAVGVFFPEISALPCALDKCGLGGSLFVGALDNENQFAITVVMALPFALLTLRGPTRVILTLVTAVEVLLSGSRSSQIAIAVLLVLCLVLAVSPKRSSRSWLAPAVGLGFLAALIFPMTVTSDSAYTGRGVLWKLALRMIGASPLLGRGQDAWAAQGAIGNVGSNATYSPHNVWLDALLAGGLVATGLVVAAIVLQCVRLGGKRLWILLPLVVAVLEGFTERSFAYYDLASTTAFFLPALIALKASGRRSSDTRDGSDSTQARLPVRQLAEVAGSDDLLRRMSHDASEPGGSPSATTRPKTDVQSSVSGSPELFRFRATGTISP